MLSSRDRGWGFYPAGAMRRFRGFHMPFFGSSLNVGALVEPLTSQMAEYLGVPGGLMAARSGAQERGRFGRDEGLRRDSQGRFRTHRHAVGLGARLHANQGKSVQVIVLRDRKQQTLTLQVNSKRHGLFRGHLLAGRLRAGGGA